MANILGELLFAVLRAIIADWACATFFRAGRWLDTMIGGRTAKVFVGMLLGLAAFILIPPIVGSLGL
jgi:hypothetical protein